MVNRRIVITIYLSGTLKLLQYHSKRSEEEKANIFFCKRRINPGSFYNFNQVELNLLLTQ